MMFPALVVICTCKFWRMIADSSLSLHCKSIFVYLWHMPCIDMVYSCHILLLSLPSHNFPVKPLHPTKELFCALQILIKALDAFILMKTRFYLENILLGYTRYISGISKEKVYTWYIPGIYHEKTFWGFQMCVTFCFAASLSWRTIHSASMCPTLFAPLFQHLFVLYQTNKLHVS